VADIKLQKKNEVYNVVTTEPHIHRELSEYFTFEVPEAKFMPLYRNKVWDGKIRLYSPGNGEIYGGLTEHLIQWCKTMRYTMEYEENKYFVNDDQIFLYKRDNDWMCPQGYCFVQPIKDNSKLSVNTELPLVGIVKHTDGRAELNSLVGFKPKTECEFVIDGKRLYRIPSQFITIKYEYQGDEEEYNPSWAKSC